MHPGERLDTETHVAPIWSKKKKLPNLNKTYIYISEFENLSQNGLLIAAMKFLSNINSYANTYYAQCANA